MAKMGMSAVRAVTEMVAYGARSRSELCQHLGMSRASITRAVEELRQAGLVEEGAKLTTPGPGRRTTSLRVRPDIGYIVGTDLEGTALRACVLDCDRQIVASDKCALGANCTMKDAMGQWTELIGDVLDRSGVEPDKVVALGVGLPGIVSRDHCRTHAYLPPGRWVDLDARSALKRFGLPVTVANNVICVSEYERRMGVARGAPAFVSVLVRYGIGAAVYADGSFLHGQEVFTGEFGHMRLDPRGPVCICGQRGCLDVFASGRTWTGADTPSDARRRRELAKRSRYLGVGLANLLKIFHPPLVSLNGIYNEYRAEVMPPLTDELRKELEPLGIAAPEVVFGEPVEFKASMGAALRAASEFLEPYLVGNVLPGAG